MKKTIAITILVLILLTPLWSWLIWFFTPASKLNIVVVNKTSEPARHQSFYWLLSHHKYFDNLLKEYDYKEDFYSNDEDQSIAGFNLSQLDSLAKEVDVAYYIEAANTDNMDEGFMTESSVNDNDFNVKDYRFLENLFRRNKLIISEFNTLGPSTPPDVLQNMEKLFLLKTSGWKGRYFPSLDTNDNTSIPQWIRENYRKQYGRAFAFDAESGIIFIHNSGNILVLENQKHLELEIPVINSTSINQKAFNIPAYVEYKGWFEVNTSSLENNIVSTFKIHSNAKGDSLLQHYNIPKKFPAIIGDNAENLRFYFCGDFANTTIQEELAHFHGIEWISRLFYRQTDEDQREFFWKFYNPLMESILDNYRNKQKVNKSERNLSEEISSSNMDTVPQNNTDEHIWSGDNNLTPASVSKESPNEDKLDAIGHNISQHSGTNSMGNWYVILSSMQTEEKAKRFINKVNYPELQIVYVPELNTYRISYGNYSSLLQAQSAFSEIIDKHPEAWIVQY